MQIKKLKNDRGFTILETLVALAVLIVSLTAAFSAAHSGLSLSINARDEVAAYFLAQEAVEMLKNVRDENSLLGNSEWLNGVTGPGDPCSPGNYCAVDSPNEYFVACGITPESCPVLKQDQTSNSSTIGMYGLDPIATSGWTDSVFRRSITIKEINLDEVAVNIVVSWSKGSSSRQFVIRENIFNWQR